MIQFDNTFLVKNIEDLDVNKLKLLNQIIRFIPKQDSNTGIEYNDHEMLVLSKIFFDHIYLFDTDMHEIYLTLKNKFDVDDETFDEMYEQNDQEGLIKSAVDSVNFESTDSIKVYFKIKNKLQLIPTSRWGDGIKEIDEDSYWYKTGHKLYDSIFGQDGEKQLSPFSYNSISGKNDLIQYMYVKLNKDNVLIFALTHDLEYEKFKWHTHKEIFFLNKNKQFAAVDWDFDEFFDLIKENYNIWDFCLDGFNGYLETFNYDVEQYLENRDLSKLSIYFNVDSDIYKFFQPLYNNYDLKLSIYKNFTRKSSYYIYIFVMDGKVLNQEEVKKLENGEEIYDKLRIAKTINDFNEYDKNGISPYDGKLYKNGELIKFPEDDLTLDNPMGFISKRHGYYHYTDGYYVKANEKEKQELDDALNLMKSLSSWAKKENII